MTGKIAYQVTDDGVTVVLRPEIGSPSSLRVTLSEAKRFGWSLLADVDPEGRGEASTDPITVGPVCIDFDNYLVTVGGAPIHLTKKEFVVLASLARRNGRLATKAELFHDIYGESDDAPLEKIIDVFVCKVRNKLGAHGARNLIETVWGNGYRLVAAPTPPLPREAFVVRSSSRSLRKRIADRLKEAPASFADLAEACAPASPNSVRTAISELCRLGLARNFGSTRRARYKLLPSTVLPFPEDRHG